MGTISDKLMRIINTKEDIRQALISKGYDVPTSIPFKEYAKMISDLPCRVDSFPNIEGIVARYSALGLTNEQMAANPVWVDKTGNGHDIQLKNFSWKGMSRVGGYEMNFNLWRNNVSSIPDISMSTTTTSVSVSVGNSTYNNNLIYIHISNWDINKNHWLKVTSTYEDGDLAFIFYNDSNTKKIGLPANGYVNILAYPEFKGSYMYISTISNKQGSFTIEQLPLYPGALVFDGVDDYSTCDNFPILTKEKGFTVVCIRQLLNKQPSSIVSKWSYLNSETGPFNFESIAVSRDEVSVSFGNAHRGVTTKPFSYFTSTSYNGNTVTPGNKTDKTNTLVVGRYYVDLNSLFAKAAIWEIVILDHDATEEELTKIKNYFIKTYPWLFFDQAWTVTGKTNEDEDRATIANITGNGNDLVLSNFGFIEGSGYNEEGEHAGYLVTDGVDDKVVSAESIAFTDTWTIITDTVFLGKASVASGILARNIFTVYNYQGSGTIAVTMGEGGSSLRVITSSIKAFSSDGTIYDAEWNEYHVEIGTIRALECLLKIGTSSNETSYFCQLAFKFLGIYNNQILSKDDCIKAYNYLQTLKSK